MKTRIVIMVTGKGRIPGLQDHARRGEGGMTAPFRGSMTSKEQPIAALSTLRSFTHDLPWPLD